MIAEILLPLPLDKGFHYTVPEGLNLAAGQRVRVPFGKRLVVGYVKNVLSNGAPRETELKSVQGVVDAEPLLGQEAFEMAAWMAKTYACSEGEALTTILPSSLGSPKKALALPVVLPEPNHTLTDDQKVVFDRIAGSLDQGHKTFLIHGVTDSGKTEIYFQLIQRVLAQGKQAIFLLPEISLTPQFIHALRSRVNAAVAIWHSQISTAERARTFEAVRSGKVSVVLGTRSALFAPFSKLGLIVMDEEHEASYKQQQRPLYHAREAALFRAQWHKCPLVLGSATPSVESYYRAQQKEFELLELKERVLGRPLPPVSVVDQRKEKEGRRLAVLSKEMLKALETRLARREQSILLMNRRGHSPFVLCQACGESVNCSRCAVTMVYHKQSDRLLCHYCGQKAKIPEKCTRCGNSKIRLAGVGTERVVEEVQNIFPHARVLRMDRDTAKGKNFYEQSYTQFRDENYDVLVGTQMVAKGFHFPRVTLVGVVDADTGLHIPDFRAAERTFQLLSQVSGRPGRSELGGEVIVQTYHPDHYAVLTATQHDYQSFFREELKRRRELRYPPFTRLCLILLQGTQEKAVFEEGQVLAERLKDLSNRMRLPTEVVGPSPALRPFLRSRHRYQILLKAQPRELGQLSEGLKAFHPKQGVRMTLDLDPVDLL